MLGENLAIRSSIITHITAHKSFISPPRIAGLLNPLLHSVTQEQHLSRILILK